MPLTFYSIECYLLGFLHQYFFYIIFSTWVLFRFDHLMFGNIVKGLIFDTVKPVVIKTQQRRVSHTVHVAYFFVSHLLASQSTSDNMRSQADFILMSPSGSLWITVMSSTEAQKRNSSSYPGRFPRRVWSFVINNITVVWQPLRTEPSASPTLRATYSRSRNPHVRRPSYPARTHPQV